MIITVHHLENSRSQRVLWLLEELGLEYDVRRYERDPKTMLAPAALRAVHPLGKSPVLAYGDQILAESGAMIQFLVERHGQGRFAPAADSPEHWRYLYWLHYAEGSAMPVFLLKLIVRRLSGPPVPLLFRPVAKRLAAGLSKSFVDRQLAVHLPYLDAELGKSTWFAGEAFSAADIQMSFVIELAVTRGGSTSPRLRAFLDRIQERPAYQRALARGGPYRVG